MTRVLTSLLEWCLESFDLISILIGRFLIYIHLLFSRGKCYISVLYL